MSSAELFDPFEDKFHTSEAGLAQARFGQTATAIRDGRVFIAGGQDGAGPLASTEYFDAKTGEFAAGPLLLEARFDHAAAPFEFGSVVLMGGSNGQNELDTVEGLFPVSGQMIELPSRLLSARRGATAVLLPQNNTILLVGGSQGNAPVANTELFDPWSQNFAAPGTLSSAGPLQAGRSDLALTASDGQALATGGLDAREQPVAAAESFAFPIITTDKTDYAPGETIRVTGKGYAANEAVELRTATEADAPVAAGQVATDSLGRFVAEVLMPAGEPFLPYSLTAAGLASKRVAHASFADFHSLSSVSPNPLTRQPGVSSLSILGSNFTGSSITADSAFYDGTALPTSVLSSTELQPQLTSFNFFAGNHAVNVLQTVFTSQCVIFFHWPL